MKTENGFPFYSGKCEFCDGCGQIYSVDSYGAASGTMCPYCDGCGFIAILPRGVAIDLWETVKKGEK